METVKRIGTLGLLVVFLFGITGLSVFHHTCSSSGQDRITVYAGIFREAPAGCCEDETSGNSSFNQRCLPRNYDAAPCCKSTTSFLSLKINSERQDKLVVRDVLPIPAPCDLPLSVLSFESQLLVRYAHYQFHSPPRFGKQLIHFLHQVKIPAPPALA